jgi:hypothetical protein
MMLGTWVYLAACGVLFYGGFCRLVRTDHRTHLCIRSVFWLLTVAAATSIAGVLVWGYAPGWPSALLATTFAAVQVATALLWTNGVPAPYVAKQKATG